MKLEDELTSAYDSFHAQSNNEGKYDYKSTSHAEYRKIFARDTTDEEKKNLKIRLAEKLANHSAKPRDGEDTYGYLLRNAQRLSEANKSTLLDSNLVESKKIGTLKSEKKKRDHEEKWMASQPGNAMNAMAAKGKKPKKTKAKEKTDSSEPIISVTVEDLGVSLDVDIDEDWDFEDIWDVMNSIDSDTFNEEEKATVKMIREDVRVCLPREMGDWMAVKVKGGVKNEEGKWEGGLVKCNCNRCNFDGRCKFVQTFESLQFEDVPDNLAAGDEMNFKAQIQKAVRTARRVNIDIAKDVCSHCPPQTEASMGV